MIDFSLAIKKLDSIHQQHLLNYWSELSLESQKMLDEQIHKLDVKHFLEQRNFLTDEKMERDNLKVEPYMDFQKASQSDIAKGEEAIKSETVGCIVVAGGQGTRLKFSGPKGMFPVTAIKHKSLFQLLAERVLAAEKKYGVALKLAIMTSPENHVDTVSFFERHHHFGIKRENLYFFTQGTLPLLNQDGNLFLESKDKFAIGPDGNGSCLRHFVENGIWSDWEQLGIKYLNFILIDNPLADPFDAGLIGFHIHQGSDITIKAVARKDPNEKVGVIVKTRKGLCVREYTEFDENEMKAKDANGSLKHTCANISLFCLSMPFVYDAGMIYYDQMPFHKALKAVKYLDDSGITKISEVPFAWKFEKYIFDIIPYAKKAHVMVCDRKECFAPLKNEKGADSIAEVQKALQAYDRSCFEKLTGQKVDEEAIFELDPQFYYPTDMMQAYWHGKTLPHDGLIMADVMADE